MTRLAVFLLAVLLAAASASAEVVRVTIDSRVPVADGRAFGATGAYERLSGTIEFALDPADKHNQVIVGLDRAPRAPDGRVHFTSTLYVIRPVDPARGNGSLLFEISNRGGKDLLGRFNGGTAAAEPIGAANVGDGFLMREGFTLVWVGWEFDVPADAVRVDAPLLTGAANGNVTVEFNRDAASPTVTLDREAPFYLPAPLDQPNATLTVRDNYWATAETIPRERWRFVAPAAEASRAGARGSIAAAPAAPTIALDGGFAPGRNYAVTYRASGARVAGVGFAAIRDAASAFRYRADLPVRGSRTYVIGVSQSGRFLRQFLYEGFNADERDRRAFDAVWAHVAGSAQGSFNEPFAMPRHLAPFAATRAPFTLQPADGRKDSLLSAYRDELQPKIFLTNSPIEYWGNGRAAALTHVSGDGRRDLPIPANTRIYFYAGAQHAGQGPLPSRRGNGQQPDNPTPQHVISRALLHALHEWTARGIAPPASRYPRVSDQTLVAASRVRFPAIPGVGDPRRITGPAAPGAAGWIPLGFFVPQVDADGNETSGIRVPEQAVPLATVTGWNFRAPAVGNTAEVYPLLGSYIPFAATRAEREASGDPRRSIEERYPSRASYLQRIRESADTLVKGRYLLQEDVAAMVSRAERHWDLATASER